MDRLYYIEYKGKKIYYIDLSNLKEDDEEVFLQIIKEAKKEISSQPLNSLLVITNFTNSPITPKATYVLKEFALHNKPYVKCAALVGVGGLKKIFLKSIEKFADRRFHIFDTVEDAKEFLIAQV